MITLEYRRGGYCAERTLVGRLRPNTPSPSQQIVPPLAQALQVAHMRPGGSGTREILYVLVASNSSPQTGSVVLYDAYAKNPKVIRTVSDVGTNPGSISTDDRATSTSASAEASRTNPAS